MVIFSHVLKCFLPGTLQATRALMVVGILLGLIAIFVATVGMKCMKCLEDDEVLKMRMAVIGGVIFLIAGKKGPTALCNHGFTSRTSEDVDTLSPAHFPVLRQAPNENLRTVLTVDGSVLSGFRCHLVC